MKEGPRRRHPRRSAAESERRPTPSSSAVSTQNPASALALRALWVSLLLIAINLVVFAPVWHYDFTNWDDPYYVTENPHVSAGLTWQGVRWAFTTGYASNWHPLTWLSHMLDVQLFGLNAGPHHVTNLLLHIANTILLFGLLHRMTGALYRSAFVAGLFAVHPLHVESVAWVTERKDVLSTLFWMLTLWAYVEYVRQARLRRYLLVLLLFALALMAKPMVVTLPLVLLLLDFWPLADARYRAATVRERAALLIREKLPLFALTVASSIVTFTVQQRGGAVGGLAAYALPRRAANAVVSYVAYIGQMLWPTRLAAFYPYPRSLPGWWAVGSILGLIVVSVLVIRAAQRRPYLPMGWLWYLGTLLPVIGLVQVGSQSRADRYTYVSLIGLFIVVAWGACDLFARWPHRRIALPAAAGIALLASAITARGQVQHWKSSVALWGHALEVTSENWRAHGALGVVLEHQGRVNEAIVHYSEALRIEPAFADAQNMLGAALADQGRWSEAMPHYREALRLKPDFAEAHNNLANALAKQGKIDEAIAHYSEALRIKPDYENAHNGLGSVLDDQGRLSEAIAHYSEALHLKPDFADAHNNLGAALVKQGRIDEAIHEFLEALRIKPDEADFHYNLAALFRQKGDTVKAVDHLETALKLKPGYLEARRVLDELRSADPKNRSMPR